MIPMENIRKLSDSYRNIQEAKFDINQVIKDLGGNFAGSNDDQMKAVQLLKGLALSDDPKSIEFMEKLDAATTQISQEMSESLVEYGLSASIKKKQKKHKAFTKHMLKKKKKKMKREEIETVEESKSLIDLLNNIKNGGKIEDTDLTEEDVNGILDFYENTLDETGQKEFNKMSITKIQSTMKKLGL